MLWLWLVPEKVWVCDPLPPVFVTFEDVLVPASESAAPVDPDAAIKNLLLSTWLCEGIWATVSVVAPTVPPAVWEAQLAVMTGVAEPVLPATAKDPLSPMEALIVWVWVAAPPVLPLDFVELAPMGTLSRMSGVPPVPLHTCQRVSGTPPVTG